MRKRNSSNFTQRRKTIYRITIRIEVVETGGEEIPAKDLIRLAGCGRKEFKKKSSTGEKASPLLHTLVDAALSFCSPCCTNRGLYSVLESDSCPSRKHDRDHRNNRQDRHQSPASSTLLETTPTHSKHTDRGCRPPFSAHKLRVGASWGSP